MDVIALADRCVDALMDGSNTLDMTPDEMRGMSNLNHRWGHNPEWEMALYAAANRKGYLFLPNDPSEIHCVVKTPFKLGVRTVEIKIPKATHE